MIVRHAVAAANVDAKGFVIDPEQACHCVIYGGALADLSGAVDPTTHLNLDFSEHTLGDCVIAEQLSQGARVQFDVEGRLAFARTRPEASVHRGRVDLDARRIAWLEIHRQRRDAALPRPDLSPTSPLRGERQSGG